MKPFLKIPFFFRNRYLNVTYVTLSFPEINQAFHSAAHKILLSSEEIKLDKFYFGALENSTSPTDGKGLGDS